MEKLTEAEIVENEINEKLKQQNIPRYNLGNVRVDSDTLKLIHSIESKFPEMTKEFKKIMISNYILFIKKQSDYGPSNISMNTNLESKTDFKMAMMGLVTRMNDKMSRLINLIFKNKESKNEPIYDSFRDISNYGIIAMIVTNNKWAK